MESYDIGAETVPSHGLDDTLSQTASTKEETNAARPAAEPVIDVNSITEERHEGKGHFCNRRESDGSVLNSETPITHHYLTFLTPLPKLNQARTLPPGPSTNDQPGRLEYPDLSKFSNPLFWPGSRKTVMVAISCVATMVTAYTAGAYAPMADLLAADYGVSRVAALTGITTFCMGFALAPMILAPYSEVAGRYPVFVVAGVFFIVFQAVCGLAPNLAAQLIAQFLKGSGASVFSTMVGGVIADLYEKEQRNTPMAFFSGSVLIGTGLGPLVASLMVQYLGSNWKWVVWHQVILDFVVIVTVVTFFRESRGSVLLSKKARALNKFYDELEGKGHFGVWVGSQDDNTDTRTDRPDAGANDHDLTDVEKGSGNVENTNPAKLQRIRWLVKEDEQRASIVQMMKTSLTRPFHFLFTEPIVFFFSLWVSFAWAVLYLTFASIPLVYRRVYNFSIAQAGLVFFAMIIGGIVATCGGLYSEQLLKHPSWQTKGSGEGGSAFWAFMRRKFPVESPESRLYFTCLTSIFLPIGLFMFGFCARPDIHWIVPAIAIVFASMGIYFVYLATFNYLADTYQTYASSSLAAQSFCRNVLGGVFPLVTGALFTNLGEGAAGGILGGVATVLTVVPWVLVFFGEPIRQRSKFAVALGRK
ncbi:major facilitator superfamily domain-containing protein [Microdochium trichocladiopsis]|uniref:Major facilitator superfamily domain-containing protein n=1 Tax=Microdochium trichocladiopsis TaxID=1682393 RepID=A0A9P8XXY7_9PEZI|nr:major facilitator superfamily domain-containing protein [Microdochium trichocladiopsis]KAH7018537.1 major facilitator superfamily domain-containing protein [Microdochium trichocladiopsis]